METTTETGRKPSEPYFEIAQDAEGWHWQLWAGNGRAVARNAIAYETKKHVLQAIKLLPGILPGARIIVLASAG